MWFNRRIQDKLKDLVAAFPVVVLTGARQSGKTSLLQRLFPSYGFVSLDLPSVSEAAETQPEAFLKKHAPPVIIDEVQYAPKLFRYLKAAVDKDRKNYGQFILTGSQKFTLMKAVSDSMTGRCALLELETLSYGEVSDVRRQSSLSEYLVRGGFPELQSRLELNRRDYLNSYIATYLERDVRALLRVSELRDFERFLRACALRSGQTLNKSDLARDVGISSPTASEWLSVLHASNQVLLLEPWFSNKTKSMVKAPKLFLSDVGLLCQLLNINSVTELLDSPLRRAVWETFVFSELRKKQLFAEGAWDIWYWRDQRGTEADFLIPQGGRYRLTEAKWSESPTLKDAGNLLKIQNILGRKQIISMEIACRSTSPYLLQSGDSDIQVYGFETPP